MAEYISKEAILKHLNDCKEDPLFDPDMARICFALSIFIDEMQAVDVQPVKHGHWEKITIVPATDTGNRILARCSECGDTVFYTVTGREITLKYCPNCGAKMDGGADNENS